MKCLVIGLGNFGSSIAVKLTELGHEVIGVDTDINKVNELKDRITYTVCLDSSSAISINTLPVRELDVAIVAVGEDFGASVMITALLKQLNVKKLLCRAISPVHESVFSAIGVDEVVHPELETAERLAFRLHSPAMVDSFNLTDNTLVVKVVAPDSTIGLTLDAVTDEQPHLKVITLLRSGVKANIFSRRSAKYSDIGGLTEKVVIQEGDILVLYGTHHYITNFIKA